MFWSCMLSGACGHTYGANGIWQVNTREKPYGPSPHGMAWGHTPWRTPTNSPALRISDWPRGFWTYECGSSSRTRVGRAPLVEGEYTRPYAVGIPAGCASSSCPGASRPSRASNAARSTPLTSSTRRTAQSSPSAGEARQGRNWPLPLPTLPIYQDWVLVWKARRAKKEQVMTPREIVQKAIRFQARRACP